MITNQIQSRLRSVVPKENISDSQEEKICYTSDATRRESLPDVVIKPETLQQVQEVLRIATEHKIPVTPRGAGTGLSGGAVPVKGGILLVFEKMNKILEIDDVNLLAVVEPGAVTADLHAEVERLNLFYPPDPSSLKVSTIGGNIAHCAGGPRALKYGVTGNYIMGLEVVLPDGEVMNVGGRTVKGVAGYDLTNLIAGSEGTLAVITKAILRLIPKPKACKSFLIIFKQLSDAADMVVEVIQAGTLPATMELMDYVTINAIEDYKPCGLPRDAGAVLLIEVDGFEPEVERQASLLDNLISKSKASSTKIAADYTERENLWTARRAAFSALARIKPSTILEDATVPRRKVPEMIQAITAIAQKYSLIIGTFGHAGDGNLHPTIVTDLRVPAELKKVDKAVAEIFDVALSLGGTLSGEHGIGIMKSGFLKNEVGAVGLRVMKDIKHSLDPYNILNPGKIFV